MLGLARNERLGAAVADEVAAAELESLAQGRPARASRDFAWRSLDSWTRVRRSVRRIKIAMASACPSQTEYHLAYLYLRRAAF